MGILNKKKKCPMCLHNDDTSQHPRPTMNGKDWWCGRCQAWFKKT